MKSGRSCYALVTPVRDEEQYIGAMMDSILAQKVLPARWIIVDDGSTDRTPQIVASYQSRFDLVELIQLPARRERKAGGEQAITRAFGRLKLGEYDFLGRFDADLLFDRDYIAQILGEFGRDPELGIAGGGLYVEKNGQLELERVPDYHVRGALKMYRRECFEQIQGITDRIGWDTIDEVYAWTKGWKTRSFFDYRVVHRRPTGEGIAARRVYWQRGKAEYYTWSHPLFVLTKAAKIAWEKLSVVVPVCFLGGFASCYFRRDVRLQDPAFAKTRREQQKERIYRLLNLRKRWAAPNRHGRRKSTKSPASSSTLPEMNPHSNGNVFP